MHLEKDAASTTLYATNLPTCAQYDRFELELFYSPGSSLCLKQGSSTQLKHSPVCWLGTATAASRQHQVACLNRCLGSTCRTAQEPCGNANCELMLCVYAHFKAAQPLIGNEAGLQHPTCPAATESPAAEHRIPPTCMHHLVCSAAQTAPMHSTAGLLRVPPQTPNAQP